MSTEDRKKWLIKPEKGSPSAQALFGTLRPTCEQAQASAGEVMWKGTEASWPSTGNCQPYHKAIA